MTYQNNLKKQEMELVTSETRNYQKPTSDGNIETNSIPYPKDEKQLKCHHLDIRMLNRKERRYKQLAKMFATHVCLDCGCIFVDPKFSNTELVFGGADGN